MSLETFHDLGPGVPFPHPIPLPTALPTDGPHVSLCVNHDWLPIIVGCLKVLLDPATFDADQATYQASRLDIWNLLQNWSNSCVNDVQFRQHDDCLLQVSFDGGSTWTTIYDGSICIAAKIADGTLQGATRVPTTTETPNICTTYAATIAANTPWTLPVAVNAGDTLQFSFWPPVGVWTDSLDVLTPYCGDGTHVTFPTGCGAGEPAHSGDPLSGSNHMKLIVNIGGTYHDIGSTSVFTVPAGVVDATCTLQANDSILWDNIGNVSIGITHCGVGWSHTFDFSLSDGSFTAEQLNTCGLGLVTCGSYSAGVAWQGVSNTCNPPNDDFILVIHRTVASTRFLTMQMEYTATSVVGVQLFGSGPSSLIPTGSHATFSMTFDQTITDCAIHIENQFGNNNAISLFKITFTGAGSDPF